MLWWYAPFHYGKGAPRLVSVGPVALSGQMPAVISGREAEGCSIQRPEPERETPKVTNPADVSAAKRTIATLSPVAFRVEQRSRFPHGKAMLTTGCPCELGQGLGFFDLVCCWQRDLIRPSGTFSKQSLEKGGGESSLNFPSPRGTRGEGARRADEVPSLPQFDLPFPQC